MPRLKTSQSGKRCRKKNLGYWVRNNIGIFSIRVDRKKPTYDGDIQGKLI